MEQVRKPKPTPTEQNSEAKRMQNEDTARQEKQSKVAREVGEAIMADLDGILDEIDELIETEQFITAEEYIQKGGE